MTEAEVTQMRKALALVKKGLDEIPAGLDTREVSELCRAYMDLEEEYADPTEKEVVDQIILRDEGKVDPL